MEWQHSESVPAPGSRPAPGPAPAGAGGSGSLRAASIASSQASSASQRVARARLMKAFLPKLLTASDELRQHLSAAAEHDEVWAAELDGYRHVFEGYRRHYADESAPHIRADDVLHGIGAGPGDAPLAGSVTRAVAAANIVRVLDELVAAAAASSSSSFVDSSGGGGGGGLLGVLQNLDGVFPDDFLPDTTEAISQGTVGLALEVRTQLFVATVREYGTAEYDPFKLLARLFCSGSTAADQTGEETVVLLAEGPYRPLAGINLGHDGYEGLFALYSARITRIYDALGDGGEQLDLAPLEREFPVGAFFERLLGWAQSSFENINELERAQRDAAQPPPQAQRLPSESIFVDAREEPQPDSLHLDSQSQSSSDAFSQPIVRASAAQKGYVCCTSPP